MSQANRRSAAVTGAGGGLGRDIALGLAAKHYRVFGTAMSPKEIADVQQASGGTVTLTRCDITDEAVVKRWAHDVATQTDGGLDLLINNAGILTPGPLEVLSLDAIRREFEVNVFGAVSVINAFLAALQIVMQQRGFRNTRRLALTQQQWGHRLHEATPSQNEHCPEDAEASDQSISA